MCLISLFSERERSQATGLCFCALSNSSKVREDRKRREEARQKEGKSPKFLFPLHFIHLCSQLALILPILQISFNTLSPCPLQVSLKKDVFTYPVTHHDVIATPTPPRQLADRPAPSPLAKNTSAPQLLARGVTSPQPGKTREGKIRSLSLLMLLQCQRHRFLCLRAVRRVTLQRPLLIPHQGQ